MDFEHARARAAELRASLLEANAAYYDRDDPIMSDAAYDAAMQELKGLETQYPQLMTSDSPTQFVGGHASKVELGKVHHRVQLQSLTDVFSLEDVMRWHTTAGEPVCVVEEKIDGLSLAATYRNGKLVQAATRGDGFVGEDVTVNARYVSGIPDTITLPAGTAPNSLLVVRCEVIMPVAAFNELNAEMEEAGKKTFANPRNAAAGSLRMKDPTVTAARGLQAIAFQIMDCEGFDTLSYGHILMSNQSDDVAILKDMGFQTVTQYYCTQMDEIEEAIKCIGLYREGLPYWTDGAVVKVNNRAVATMMGNTAKTPKWAVAYKYPPEQKETTIRDIITQTGRTGVITPVAVFDPVLLCGTSVSKATLHNQQFMDGVLGGVCIGDKILVHKSGEIIPEVVRVVSSMKGKGAEPFHIRKCPVCGADAVTDKETTGSAVQMVCSNPCCRAKLAKRIEYWCSRPIMDIAGIGPSVISALLEEQDSSPLVEDIPDLYRLDEETWTAVFGVTRGPKYFKSVQGSKHRGMDRVLAGLGIPGVGPAAGKAIAKQFANIWCVAEADEDRLAAIDGIGAIMAADIHAFFDKGETADIIRSLQAYGVNIDSADFGEDKGGPLSGCTFCITGTLPTMSREDAATYIEAHGGKVVSSVSKKTSYLVAGESAGSKLQKAEAAGIPVIDETQLRAMAEGE